MSYREQDGQVILSMSKEDYELLLIALGSAVGAALQGRGMLGLRVVCDFANRLNQGNPHYIPYQSGDR